MPNTTAIRLLAALYATGRCTFWSDAISYQECSLDYVIGHRQVTDACLASLAVANGSRLATFDEGLAEALPAAITLIPR